MIDLQGFRQSLLKVQKDPVDAFSEILSGIKLNGAVFFNAEFSDPWGFASPASQTLACTLAPGAPHLVIYHLLTEGRAVAQTGDGQVIALEPGDVVVFPHGDPHFIGSGVGPVQPGYSSEIMKKLSNRDLTPLRVGGGGEAARFVCGFMACDPHLGRPILNGLPSVFKVNVRADRSGQWLESSILHLVEEAGSGRVGSEAMLAKLSEALFVDTLRRYIASLPDHQTGWLAGARDPIVGKSLGLLHRKVAYPWTIAELAGQVGLSRSALAERFIRYLSEPPMTYLTRWRLQLAAHSLAHTAKSVADIASEVGYESESAFHRAFKRDFLLPPAQYRREQRAVAEPRPAALSRSAPT